MPRNTRGQCAIPQEQSELNVAIKRSLSQIGGGYSTSSSSATMALACSTPDEPSAYRVGVVSTMPLGNIKFRAEDENAVVPYLSADEEARLRNALVTRDNTRRAARKSANEWRRGPLQGVGGVQHVHGLRNATRAPRAQHWPASRRAAPGAMAGPRSAAPDC
jgi:hypothetical protein